MHARSPASHAFAHYLRTGRRLPPSRFPADAIELKFNPYHDPDDGRFTFPPGGGGFDDGVFRPTTAGKLFRRIAAEPPRRGIGDNRAPHDPITLEQTFPGLRGAPGGSIIALADGVFGLTEPAAGAVDTLYQAQRRGLIADIRELRPGYVSAELAPASSFEAKVNEINQLRGRRAADLYLKKGDIRELQVETIRVLQTATDRAYATGIKLQSSGLLGKSASKRMALGNYVDGRVRRALRDWLQGLGISNNRGEVVRVNARDYLIDGAGTFSRPDARVGRLAYDVTLADKGLGTQQIRNFFRGESRAGAVIIIRPRQEFKRGAYLIKKPGI